MTFLRLADCYNSGYSIRYSLDLALVLSLVVLQSASFL